MLARYIVPYFFPQGPDGTPVRNVIDAALPALQNCIAVLERQLNGRAYLIGQFTLADIFFAPTLYYASTLPEGAEMVTASMRLTAYLARVTSRQAFKATLPPPLPARAPRPELFSRGDFGAISTYFAELQSPAEPCQ
jgi:glutathione S-transferase